MKNSVYNGKQFESLFKKQLMKIFENDCVYRQPDVNRGPQLPDIIVHGDMNLAFELKRNKKRDSNGKLKPARYDTHRLNAHQYKQLEILDSHKSWNSYLVLSWGVSDDRDMFIVPFRYYRTIMKKLNVRTISLRTFSENFAPFRAELRWFSIDDLIRGT